MPCVTGRARFLVGRLTQIRQVSNGRFSKGKMMSGMLKYTRKVSLGIIVSMLFVIGGCETKSAKLGCRESGKGCCLAAGDRAQCDGGNAARYCEKSAGKCASGGPAKCSAKATGKCDGGSASRGCDKAGAKCPIDGSGKDCPKAAAKCCGDGSGKCTGNKKQDSAGTAPVTGT